MIEIIIKLSLLIFAYLIGSLPWGWILGKMKGIDIREHGSKNIGATNTGRVLGKKYAIIAYALDTIKGFIPVYIAISLGPEYYILSPILYGIVAVLGHTFPIYLGFKGGKAVATGGGVVLAFAPVLYFSLVAIFFIITYITRYVSAGSLVAASTALIATILYAIFLDYDVYFPIGAVIIVIIIFARHKANIQRIVHKQEAKVEWRKKKDD